MISTTRIIGRITVTVEFDVDIFGSILPLHHADGTVDQVAVSEYEEFIVNALEVFEEHDFDVVEEAESDRSHSVYYSLAKHDDVLNEDYKFVLFVRISDHTIPDRSKAGRKKYYQDKSEQLKKPASKKKQTWKFKDIIVNKDIFDSYDEALEDIRRRLSNI